MSNLNWNQIRADFHDANQSMATGSGALSQAGTIFGQLRKSILDEEQRAIDNAYREKDFEEKVRQFGVTNELERDKFGETSRHNKATEQYNQDTLAETRRHNQESERNYRDNLREQAAYRNLLAQEHQLEFNSAVEAQQSAKMQGLLQASLSSEDNIAAPALKELEAIKNDTSLPLSMRSDAAILLQGANEMRSDPNWKLNPRDAERTRMVIGSRLSGKLGDISRARLSELDKAQTDANKQAKKEFDDAVVNDANAFEKAATGNRLDSPSRNMVNDSTDAVNTTLRTLFPDKNYAISSAGTYRVLRDQVADGLRENVTDGQTSFNRDYAPGSLDVTAIPGSPSAHAIYNGIANGTLMIGNKIPNQEELKKLREAMGITEKSMEGYKEAQKKKTEERAKRVDVGVENPLGLSDDYFTEDWNSIPRW